MSPIARRLRGNRRAVVVLAPAGIGGPLPVAQVDVVVGRRGRPAEAPKATAPTPVRPGAQISRTEPTDALTGPRAAGTDRGAPPTPAHGGGGGVTAPGSASVSAASVSAGSVSAGSVSAGSVSAASVSAGSVPAGSVPA